jgi:hypothetical protein
MRPDWAIVTGSVFGLDNARSAMYDAEKPFTDSNRMPAK